MSGHSACMPCIKAVIAQCDRHIATAFCSLTVIPSNQSCTVRCHVHSYHPQLRTSGSASYPRATCTTHKHQHSIAHIKQQLIHQQHHIICHSCHPMPPTAPHTHENLHTSGCASSRQSTCSTSNQHPSKQHAKLQHIHQHSYHTCHICHPMPPPASHTSNAA